MKRANNTDLSSDAVAAQKAMRENLTHYSAFPTAGVSVVPEGENRMKPVLINPETGNEDPKSMVVVELPPFRADTGRMSGEGNLGFGEYAQNRARIKFSCGLLAGNCDLSKPLPEKIDAEQKEAIRVMQEISRNLLTAWYDYEGGAIRKVSKTAYETARANYVRDNIPNGKTLPVAELTKRENSDPVMKAEIRREGLELFIAGARMPFKSIVDPDGKTHPPVAWVQSAVWRLASGAYNAAAAKTDKAIGPSIDQVPTSSENIPRLQRQMGAYKYSLHLPKYAVAGAKMQELPHPTKEVDDIDEFGNPVLKDGVPVKVRVPLLSFDPLFVSKSGKSVRSLVQCRVVFALSDGGKEQKYGIKLSLIGPIVIIAQAPHVDVQLTQYEASIATGLICEDEEPAEKTDTTAAGTAAPDDSGAPKQDDATQQPDDATAGASTYDGADDSASLYAIPPPTTPTPERSTKRSGAPSAAPPAKRRN